MLRNIIKLLKFRDEEKILKAVKGRDSSIQRKRHKDNGIFLIGNNSVKIKYWSGRRG